MTPLKITAFPGASNWPLWAGNRLGMFAANGIELHLEPTTNSRKMARDLHHGEADIAMTSIDNVVAYVTGQGEETLQGKVDFAAFLGLDDGLLSLMARPGIGSVQELAGKVVAVDAPTTGFAFVLYRLLQECGVAREEVRIVPVGSGALRKTALLESRCDATLLNAPLSLSAAHKGMRVLTEALPVIGPYQGVVAAARRKWLHDNLDLAKAFAAGLSDAMTWLTDPTHKELAKGILAENAPGLAPVTDAAFSRLIEMGGLHADLHIDEAGTRKVISLRNAFGPGAGIAEGIETYIFHGITP
jgi:ABC-type nitrate/sulfonate/bicarbonate transport system substrate-binding protein